MFCPYEFASSLEYATVRQVLRGDERWQRTGMECRKAVRGLPLTCVYEAQYAYIRHEGL